MGAQPYSGISFQSEKWIQPEHDSGEDEPSRQRCGCHRSNLDADANQALLHVIELLWKENKELRSEIMEKTFEVEKANSKAVKREAMCRASPNNQCNDQTYNHQIQTVEEEEDSYRDNVFVNPIPFGLFFV